MSKKPQKELDSMSMTSSAGSSSEDEENLKKKQKTIDFEIKKPGPHAKAGEWRKWKTMQREIKQARLEKRLKKQQNIDKEKDENAIVLNDLKENPTKKTGGRNYTLSIAVPSSILSKVQSKELKLTFVGSFQIARAACLYCVDEIVVYNEEIIGNHIVKEDNNQLMIKILEYLECPQYLRKKIFPHQKLLEFVGLLPPLDASHHLKINDSWEYREGVTTDILCKEEDGCWVDVGLHQKLLVDKKLKPNVRVTVKKHITNGNKLKGLVVSPITPRVSSGIFWGYQVRYADSFKHILQECPFDGGYDLKISSSNNCLDFSQINKCCYFKHALIVFSGSQSIQSSMDSDERLRANHAEQLFDYIIDKQSDIGSRTVRSEEAILITLSTLATKLFINNSFVNDVNDEDDDDNETKNINRKKNLNK